jgi:esterase/lipase superfamily enzyme
MADPKNESKEDLKGLYDLAIPLGMPVTVIRKLVENFDVDLVKRLAKVDMIGEVEEQEILVLRGDLETILAAKKYMFEALDKRIEEWDKSDRYAHIAPPGAKRRMKVE